ncbi:MAG: hypothetical protein AAGH89_18435 [Verrucomicrobiota bacterium]
MEVVMKARFSHKNGYSLVEILVTSSIMMAAIAAACALTLVTVSQEEAATRSARALNYFENTMRLYQLGLDRTEILNVIPAEPSVVSFTVTNVTGSGAIVPGVGELERADMQIWFRTAPNKDSSGTTITYSAGDWTGGSGSQAGTNNDGVRQSNTYPVYRPRTRAANTW